MKRFRALMTIGVVYVVLWFGFSVFDSFKIFNKTLNILGLRKSTIEKPVIQRDPTDDPCPPPPPPPPKPGG